MGLRTGFFLCYDGAMKKLDDHHRVEPDLLYWLEHVAHWHALLFAVVAVVSLLYVFSSSSPVLAG